MARSIAVGLTKGSNLAYLKVWGGKPCHLLWSAQSCPLPISPAPLAGIADQTMASSFRWIFIGVFSPFHQCHSECLAFPMRINFYWEICYHAQDPKRWQITSDAEVRATDIGAEKANLPAARWRGEFCLLFFEIFCSHELGFRKSHQKLPTNLACLHQPFNASFSIETGFKPRSIPLQISSWRKIMTANIKSRMWATIKTVSVIFRSFWFSIPVGFFI